MQTAASVSITQNVPCPPPNWNARKFPVSRGSIRPEAPPRKSQPSTTMAPISQGRWALEMALDHAKQREAFGAKISEYQGVSFPLAESATELHAAHLMGLNAATLLDRGDKALKELSMAKAYSVQAGLRAVDRAIQTHGGMGLTNEVGLVHAWQDLRIVNIADGTNEILTRMIAQRLLAGDLDL